MNNLDYKPARNPRRNPQLLTCGIDQCVNPARHWIRTDTEHPCRRRPVCHRHWKANQAALNQIPQPAVA